VFCQNSVIILLTLFDIDEITDNNNNIRLMAAKMGNTKKQMQRMIDVWWSVCRQERNVMYVPN